MRTLIAILTCLILAVPTLAGDYVCPHCGKHYLTQDLGYYGLTVFTPVAAKATEPADRDDHHGDRDRHDGHDEHHDFDRDRHDRDDHHDWDHRDEHHGYGWQLPIPINIIPRPINIVLAPKPGNFEYINGQYVMVHSAKPAVGPVRRIIQRQPLRRLLRRVFR
jgi:hypothetical protein